MIVNTGLENLLKGSFFFMISHLPSTGTQVVYVRVYIQVWRMHVCISRCGGTASIEAGKYCGQINRQGLLFDLPL